MKSVIVSGGCLLGARARTALSRWTPPRPSRRRPRRQRRRAPSARAAATALRTRDVNVVLSRTLVRIARARSSSARARSSSRNACRSDSFGMTKGSSGNAERDRLDGRGTGGTGFGRTGRVSLETGCEGRDGRGRDGRGRDGRGRDDDLGGGSRAPFVLAIPGGRRALGGVAAVLTHEPRTGRRRSKIDARRADGFATARGGRGVGCLEPCARARIRDARGVRRKRAGVVRG